MCRNENVPLNFFSWQDLGWGHAKQIDKWRIRLRQRDTQCVGVQSLQALNAFYFTSTKFFGALHTLKEPGTW